MWYTIYRVKGEEQKKTLTNKNFKVATLQQKGMNIMKINGTEVKGIKKAVGRYNSANKSGEPIVMIIFDTITNTVACASVEWFLNNQEIVPNGYLRYENISDLLCDVYDKEYVKPTMTNIQAVLRECVL